MKRKRRSKKNNNAAFILIFASSILAVLLMGGYFVWSASYKEPTLDEASLCPLEGEITKTAILLDGTDQLSEETIADIKNRLQIYVETLSRFQKIELYVLQRDTELGEPFFSKCNPGSTADLTDLQASGLTANPRMIEERWQAEFWQPLNEALQRTLNLQSDADRSPILHAIQWIHLNSRAHPPSKLVLISDFMENTEDYSVYRDGLDPDLFSASAAQKKYGADYSQTDFESWIIQREDTYEIQDELKKFWYVVLTGYGARNFETFTLVGVQE